MTVTAPKRQSTRPSTSTRSRSRSKTLRPRSATRPRTPAPTRQSTPESSGKSSFSLGKALALGGLGLLAAPVVLPLLGAGIIDEIGNKVTGGRWADWMTPHPHYDEGGAGYGGFGSSGS